MDISLRQRENKNIHRPPKPESQLFQSQQPAEQNLLTSLKKGNLFRHGKQRFTADHCRDESQLQGWLDSIRYQEEKKEYVPRRVMEQSMISSNEENYFQLSILEKKKKKDKLQPLQTSQQSSVNHKTIRKEAYSTASQSFGKETCFMRKMNVLRSLPVNKIQQWREFRSVWPKLPFRNLETSIKILKESSIEKIPLTLQKCGKKQTLPKMEKGTVRVSPDSFIGKEHKDHVPHFLMRSLRF